MHRYPTIRIISSGLDPIDDVLVLLEYLTVKEYVVELLVKSHQLENAQVEKRSESIVPHMRTALAYFRQIQSGAPELSFLPAYYGILNLIKTYVLFGPHHNELAGQQVHGASHRLAASDTRDLLTDAVQLKVRGALPLFYRTVTGQPWPAPSQITMERIYPYVWNISAEYFIATGKDGKLARFELCEQTNKGKGTATCTASFQREKGDTTVYSKKDFKVLRCFVKNRDGRDTFVSGPIRVSPQPGHPDFRQLFRPYLIYRTYAATETSRVMIATPISSEDLLLPEELPIALLFFHMSSVVRYCPQFLEKIQRSRFWPMMLAARQHCVLRFLILAWSYFHQEELVIHHDIT